jgi:uncharacterized membrane protein
MPGTLLRDGVPHPLDDGERIAALEVKVAFQSLQLSELKQTIGELRLTVGELRDMLVAARGVRWLLMGLITLVPIATTVVSWFAFFKPVKP